MINFVLAAGVLYWFYNVAREAAWTPKMPTNDRVVIVIVQPDSDFTTDELNWFKKRKGTQVIDIASN